MTLRKIFTEEELIQAYDEFADSIFRHCYLRTNDRDLSKDLTAETFRHLWAFASYGNVIDSVKIFLYRRIDSLIKERRLVEKRLATVTRSDPAGYLTTIPSEERKLCVLHFVDGFSAEEICTMFGGSADALLKKLHELNTRFLLSS